MHTTFRNASAALQKFTCPKASSRDLQMLGWLSTQAGKIIVGH
jgi:hypothetical protein